MKSLSRLVGILALVAAFASADSLYGQISIGGLKIQNDDSAQNKDDAAQNNSIHQSNLQQQRTLKLKNVQQRFPGGQNSQNQANQGQNDSNQIQRAKQQIWNQSQQSQNQQAPNWQSNNNNAPNVGQWNSGKWQGSRDFKKWTKALGGNQQPFSPQWYKEHPKAWKHSNSNVNAWVGGTLPGVYGWLGWDGMPAESHVHYGHADHFDHAHYGDWYPLGVFSLMSGPGDDGTRIVQLAIDHHGHIAGNYYDMITAANYSISGDVSRKSQRVSWSLNKNKSVRFRAPLIALMQPYGTITVRLPGGEQHWQFVRLED